MNGQEDGRGCEHDWVGVWFSYSSRALFGARFIAGTRFSVENVGRGEIALNGVGDADDGDGLILSKQIQPCPRHQGSSSVEIEDNKTIDKIDLNDFRRRWGRGTDAPWFCGNRHRLHRGAGGTMGTTNCSSEENATR